MRIKIADNLEFEAVRVLATDFNGHTFDGFPFSDAPDWLHAALNTNKLRVHPDNKCADYALWEVDHHEYYDVVVAEPGDYIIHINGKLVIMPSLLAAVLINK